MAAVPSTLHEALPKLAALTDRLERVEYLARMLPLLVANRKGSRRPEP